MKREQHAERFDVRRRLATKAGIWQRRQTPRGYTKGDERRLVIDGESAEEVRLAFERARAGDPLVRIASDLKMTPSGTRQLLRNRVYLGELRVGEYVNPSAHPALIEPELFGSVQARLDAGGSAAAICRGQRTSAAGRLGPLRQLRSRDDADIGQGRGELLLRLSAQSFRRPLPRARCDRNSAARGIPSPDCSPRAQTNSSIGDD